MRFAFTDFVRRAEPAEPYPPGFDAAWRKLHDALIGELRKRSLWNVPPSCLGLCGFSHWSEPGALDELTADCFTEVIIRRLPTLKTLLGDMENVEGVVFRNIRNFLIDTQKKHNPFDYRVFEVLRRAILRLLEAGKLHLLDGDPRIRNTTVLGFVPAGDPEGAHGAELGEHVRTWGEDLMPELVTARPAELASVEERTGAHLVRLAAQGVGAFRFRDVLEPLKSDLRQRWSVLWQEIADEAVETSGDGERASLVWSARPDSGFEERQLHERLLLCVSEALTRLEDPGTRAYLEKLWTFFRHRLASTPDELPSRRKLAELLGIPRYRLPELYEILREDVERCRTALRQPLREGEEDQAREAAIR